MTKFFCDRCSNETHQEAETLIVKHVYISALAQGPTPTIREYLICSTCVPDIIPHLKK